MALQFIEFENMLNWSIDNILQDNVLYNPQYPLVALYELMTFEQYPFVIEDDVWYQQVTVKGSGEGIVKRADGYKQGQNIKTKHQNRLRNGQLVLSRIDARNGAFAVVPESLEGAIVTKDFPTFRVDEERVRPQYLQLLLSSDKFTEQLSHGSKGTTNRQRVELSYLLNQEIPLPTLSEQDVILSRYNQQIAAIEEKARKGVETETERDHYFNTTLGLHEAETEIVEQPKASLQFIDFDALVSWNVETALRETLFESSVYPVQPLYELQDAILLVKRGESPRYVTESPVKMLNQKCVRWNYIDTAYAKSVEDVWADKINDEYKTQEGDILVNSTGEGTLGRSAVVDSDSSHLLHDSHVLLLRVNPAIINPTYLSLIINSHYGQTQIEQLKSAKTTKQTELGIANLLKLIIPVPSLSVQKALAEKVSAMNREIEILRDTETVKATAKAQFSTQIFK